MKKILLLLLFVIVFTFTTVALSATHDESTFDEYLEIVSNDYLVADESSHDHLSSTWRYWECSVHSGHFHHFYSFFENEIVSAEEFAEWALPLIDMRTSPDHECYVNLLTFIEHFEIPRERFQQFIDNNPLFLPHFNLDILYSGDRALIEAYYSIENQNLHNQIAHERNQAFEEIRNRNYHEQIGLLQQIVNENVQLSRYFHDILTFVSLRFSSNIGFHYDWMRGLVDAGEYERVNIIEFANRFRLSEIGLEHIMNRDGMNFFTHYNLDIIFSGDLELITAYYSRENEALHTAQVQEAFDQRVIIRGVQDVSWMLGEYWQIDTSNMEELASSWVITDIPIIYTTCPSILQSQPGFRHNDSTFEELMGRSSPATIRIDGWDINFPYYEQRARFINREVVVPLRAVMEELGFTVEWLEDRQVAVLTKPGYKVGIQIGNYTMIVNGEFIPLETAPHIRNDRILVPLLAIAEATGLEVHLDGIHAVDIFTGNNS